MSHDPRIACLDLAAREAAENFNATYEIEVATDRKTKYVRLRIPFKGPFMVRADETGHVLAHLDIGRLDELVRDLMAARADLVKLMGIKP